jgi:excisionase family DNA binding protein
MASCIQRTILSTADVARLFNVTETTVKRWADEGTLKCQKTPGGHRKFDMRCVVEFAEKNHFEPVGALAIPGGDRLGQRIQVAVLGRDFSALVAAFVEKALSPDPTDLSTYLSYLYQHRVQLWEIHDLIIRPGMEEIGARWSRGEIGINHEHRASYETVEALVTLQTQIRLKSQKGRSAVCSCLGEELHEIGLRCAAHLFESEGWSTTYLGARTPVEAVTTAIRETQPTAVSVSVTYVPPGGTPAKEFRCIVEAAREVNAQIILGGRGAHLLARDPACPGSLHTSSRQLLTSIEAIERKI